MKLERRSSRKYKKDYSKILFMKETNERKEYREKCKHFLLPSEIYTAQSGSYGGWHLTMGCDGKCRIMKRYDKKQEKIK